MHREILSFLTPLEDEALALLKCLVEIQSGSRNKPGLDRMAGAMADALSPIMTDVRIIRHETFGNMIQASTAAASSGQKGFLLMGHMDTVFPEDTAFRNYREDELRCYGPGVYDMKGGLVVGVYALKALQAQGLLDSMPVTFLCNSDEEIGSPASRPWIEDQAAGCRAAFVLEGGGPDREVVTARKGRLGLCLTVRGRAGHAAKGGVKASAILELAHKIVTLEALNDSSEITINVGQVGGGIGPNTVAENAWALVDMRFLTPEGRHRALNALETAVTAVTVPGTCCEIAEVAGRPAMPRSEGNIRLFHAFREQARVLGYKLKDELRHGVSDANIIAGLDVPVLDGLGPVGDMDHSDQEYILKQSVMERAALLAVSMADPALRGVPA